MANTLIKKPLPTGGGGGGGGGGDGGNSGGLTEGTPCFYAVATAIAQLWQGHSVYIAEANKFKVYTSNPAQYYYVTGSCSGGYVSLSYEYVDTTIYPRSD